MSRTIKYTTEITEEEDREVAINGEVFDYVLIKVPRGVMRVPRKDVHVDLSEGRVLIFQDGVPSYWASFGRCKAVRTFHTTKIVEFDVDMLPE